MHIHAVSSTVGYYRFLVAKSAVSDQPRHATLYVYTVTQESRDELTGDGNDLAKTLFNLRDW